MDVAWEIINRTLSREKHSGFDTVCGRSNLSAAASVITNNGFSVTHPEENDLFTWYRSLCCAYCRSLIFWHYFPWLQSSN